ncbi:DUF2017 family protein [Microbacterium lushaniae]|nr:DUF2017 family protein [Microbacterium lushaniae]KAA9150694.1 DUF2017 family protein [Microbacterium lushaniae]
MSGRLLVLELTTVEVAHLMAITEQFLELLRDADSSPDPAVTRLVPDAYPDDPRASGDFRRLTSGDLLDRRAADARTLLGTLAQHGPVPAVADLDEHTAMHPLTVTLDTEESAAWLRTLAALRLVLASRMGIVDEDDDPVDDPRAVLYDRLGQRLDTLVAAVGPA